MRAIVNILLVILFSISLHGHEGENHSGEIEIELADNFETQFSEEIYYLKDSKTGKRAKLDFKKGIPAGLQPRLKVKVKGKYSQGTIEVAADGDVQREGEVPAEADTVLDERSVLILKVNFADSTVPCSEALINDINLSSTATKSVKNFYKKTSNGKLDMSGRVATVTIANTVAGSTCDYYAWATAADTAARAQLGIEPGSFEHVAYSLPSNVPCSWGGLGQLRSRLTWIKSCNNTRYYAHEFGHNFGMHHAVTPSKEYGDGSDVMGSSYTEINAPHREQLGWLPAEKIGIATADGVHTVSALNFDPSTTAYPHMIKIPAKDTGGHIYVSYRTATRIFDASLSTAYRTINVHRYRGGVVQTYLLGAPAVGASVIDAVNGIEIINRGVFSDAATFEIKLSAGCVRQAPTVTVTPDFRLSRPGSSNVYSLTVKNNDAVICGSSVFHHYLRTLTPTGSYYYGMSAAFSPSSLTLAPGATGTLKVTVTPQTSTVNGTYTLNFHSYVSGKPPGIGSARLTVDAVSSILPPTGLKAARSTTYPNGAINLSWTDNSADETGFEIQRSLDGVNFVKLTTRGANTTSYYVSGLTHGTTYYFRVRSYNGAYQSVFTNTASASTSEETAPPSSPAALTAVKSSSYPTSAIVLKWQDTSNNEDGFEIERSLDGVSYTLLARAGAGATTYTNSKLYSGTTYYYRVRAYNTLGKSSYAGPASAATDLVVATPVAPSY